MFNHSFQIITKLCMIFTHMKLWVWIVRHSFKWVNLNKVPKKFHSIYNHKKKTVVLAVLPYHSGVAAFIICTFYGILPFCGAGRIIYTIHGSVPIRDHMATTIALDGSTTANNCNGIYLHFYDVVLSISCNLVSAGRHMHDMY